MSDELRRRAEELRKTLAECGWTYREDAYIVENLLADRERMRDRIAELETQRGEPVATIHAENTGCWIGYEVADCKLPIGEHKVYPAPPAPSVPDAAVVFDPENDLYSDAMDRAFGRFHSYQHGALKNATRNGGDENPETYWRRGLADALKAYVEDQPLYLASPQQVAPSGWKLVPVEPTNEMLDAVMAADARGQLSGCSGEAFFVRIYRAMTRAAPAPEVGK